MLTVLQMRYRQNIFHIQGCNLKVSFDNMEPHQINTDLTIINGCLRLIGEGTQDTTKIIKYISIPKKVPIVDTMIKVKKERGE